MTLIIGIKCSNGIVVGADGAATLGNVAGHTIMQPVAKLNVIRNEIIVGVSGPVSLSQLYCDAVEHNCDGLDQLRVAEVCRKLRTVFIQDAQVAFQIAALTTQVVGSAAQSGVLHSTLVALATCGTPHLIQFDYQCAPEIANKDLPFVTIGSGQAIADPFLAFIRSIFWEDRLPSLAEGSFALMWTLEHAIRTAPGGIAEPTQMATLQINSSGQTVAKILPPSDLREHKVMIGEAEKHLRDFKQFQQPTSDEPKPPSPPTVSGA